MTDVLLIQPPVRDFYLTQKRTLPYGLARIATALRRRGFTVRILDCLATRRQKTIDRPPEMARLDPYYGRPDASPFALFHHFRHYGYSFQHIRKVIRDIRPAVVGVSSLFTAYSAEAIAVAETARFCLPECVIVMGGHHPTALPEDVLACGAVDYVILGDGETAFPPLVEALRERRPVDRLPGVAFRTSEGTVQANDPAPTMLPYDPPPPALDLIDFSFYRRNKKAAAAITASKGCPFHCSYCALGRADTDFFQRPAASVLHEIEHLVETHDTGFIDFEDENLSLNRSWFMELLSGLIRRFNGNGPELRAMNGLFPPSLDGEVLSAMKQAGFKMLNLSVGSTSRAQLKRFNRPDVSNAIGPLLDQADAGGLDAVCYLIIGAPGQTAASSLADMMRLARHTCLIGLSVFYPCPGSRDYAQCRERGMLPKRPSLFRSSVIPLTDTTSRKETITLLRLGRMLNFMKRLIDEEGGLPEARPFDKDAQINPRDRKETGKRLLSCFFHDRRIQGVTPDGTIYAHEISDSLGVAFLEQARTIHIKGSRHA